MPHCRTLTAGIPGFAHSMPATLRQRCNHVPPTQARGARAAPRTHTMVLWSFAACACAALNCVAAPAPERSLTRLDEEFGERVAGIATRAEAAGVKDIAAVVRGWSLPALDDRQVVLAILPQTERPAGIEGDTAEKLWEEFLAARRERAAGTFALARAETRSCASVELLYRALRDDPDHARARAAAGYVRRGDRWVVPEAAERLDRGEAWDPAFGWQPRGRLARFQAGERPDRGRWVPADEDDARRRTVADGRRFSSDHWEILSAAPYADAAALAAGLEETAAIWRQVFGAVSLRPTEWRHVTVGGSVPRAAEPFAAVLCVDREQYVTELTRVEPAIARTTAIYWRPTQTAWFCAATGAARAASAGVPPTTVRHEAAHQLCAESTATSPLAGERCNFWAIEAAACYLESARATGFGWTVGGPDAGRMPAARRLLVEEEFHVPIAELCGLGRAAFQADERLPRMYDEIAGIADFLMNGRGGRYREAFVEHLARVYAGTADPDTLARLCGTTSADLDAEYRRHLSR